ncbi:competence type IV pilus minor pilin ComGD [Metabacillus litoralis]|uniref:competence type IV pilus minor pilin ComGD n=1 Tax=Metabacillus litoralis TaxID=152268 RepID=UPI00203F9160|nr:competence type IV pilus minor pilin ComGD [Metabacillus litoralis]MCM3650448.1 type II secretion system GspH family protein [Metabacillus litoralis]
MDLHQKHKKNGFTLLESLLVLSIVSIMSLVLITNIVPIHQKKVIESFLTQFEKDLMYAQQFALVNEESVYLLINAKQQQYDVKSTSRSTPFLKRNYSSDIVIEGSALSNRIIYNSNGSIQKSGTIYIYYKKSTYKATFYLGKGRFKIEKL